MRLGFANVALNAVVILGFLCAVLVVPFLLLQLVRFGSLFYVSFGFAAAWFGIVFFGMVGYNLWQQSMQSKRKRNWVISTPGVVATVVAPGVLACCCAAIWLGSGPLKEPRDVVYASVFVAILLAIMLVTWGIAELLKPKVYRLRLGEFVVMSLAAPVALAAGILVFMALYIGWHALLDGGQLNQPEIMLLLLGPPTLVFAFGVATTVFTGMVGRVYFERSREWWSRLNAWLLSFGAAWAIWMALAFFSLPLLVWVQAQIGDWVALLGTGWIGSLLTAVLFKKPEATSKRLAMNVDSVLNFAASVFIAGLLLVLAALMAQGLLWLSDVQVDFSQFPVTAAKAAYEVKGPGQQLAFTVAAPADGSLSLISTIHAYLIAFGSIDSPKVLGGGLTMPAVVLLALFGIVLLFSARVDVNKFSLHNMYKNRLVRCYLGASNQSARNEQPFTGLDDADDVPLSALGGSVDESGRTASPAQRPMQIINAALNITQGSNLAWQERKAASFIFTPVICGYSLERTQGDSTSLDNRATGEVPGYRLTVDYGARDHEEKGFTLGMALATSGAALSPNMGHASRAARAFVLTLFNVRLGRWSANPAGEAWRTPSPRLGLIPLLQELFGYSNERRNFVYLSDGGHFDNLGIYELVRRRCATIVAVDAGADPERKMGDLAETIRKCRVDLGVEVVMPELPWLEGDEKGEAVQGYVKGAIRYNLSDPAQDGTLILIKPTMSRTRGEPVDLLNYAQQNPPFPQQTTSDQFFDESQFESYRRLGAYITEECLERHGSLLPEKPARFTPLPAPLRAEPSAHSTKFIAALLAWLGRKSESLPSREGALVDMHIGLLLMTIAGLALFAAYDKFLLGVSAGVCFTRAGCEASLDALFAAGETSPHLFMIRACADNLFVLLYSAMLVTGFLVSLSRPSSARFLLPALCFLVLSAAGVDMTENIRQMSWLETGGEAPQRAIAAITQAKFVLVGIALLVLLLLERSIARVLIQRWQW